MAAAADIDKNLGALVLYLIVGVITEAVGSGVLSSGSAGVQTIVPALKQHDTVPGQHGDEAGLWVKVRVL
jgi:tetraacyldisaccharide-1-P 4'-kinase